MSDEKDGTVVISREFAKRLVVALRGRCWPEQDIVYVQDDLADEMEEVMAAQDQRSDTFEKGGR